MSKTLPTPDYERDGITLFCGDCLEILTVPAGEVVDAVITDPPYDEPSLPLCNGNTVVFCDPLNRPEGHIDEILFWIKTPSTKNTSRRCSRFVEEILVVRQGPVFNRLHWSQMIGVYEDRHIYPTEGHPFEKPLSLIERLVRIYTNVGDVVLDPYMGSGTTGVACIQLGRKFIGIEKERKYFDIAVKRIEEAFAGQGLYRQDEKPSETQAELIPT